MHLGNNLYAAERNKTGRPAPEQTCLYCFGKNTYQIVHSIIREGDTLVKRGRGVGSISVEGDIRQPLTKENRKSGRGQQRE